MPARKLNGNLVRSLNRTFKTGLPLRIVAARHGITRETLHEWIKIGREAVEKDDVDEYHKWCVKVFIGYETRADELITGQYEVLSENKDPRVALQILEKRATEDWGDDDEIGNDTGQDTDREPARKKALDRIKGVFGVLEDESLDG